MKVLPHAHSIIRVHKLCLFCDKIHTEMFKLLQVNINCHLFSHCRTYVIFNIYSGIVVWLKQSIHLKPPSVGAFSLCTCRAAALPPGPGAPSVPPCVPWTWALGPPCSAPASGRPQESREQPASPGGLGSTWSGQHVRPT